MKRMVSLLMILVMLFQLIPFSAGAAGSSNKELTPSEELREYGTITAAMNAYAEKAWEKYGYEVVFSELTDVDLMAFRSLVDKIYKKTDKSRDSVSFMDVVTLLGFVYFENSGDWNAVHNQVELYLKHLLMLIEMENTPFEQTVAQIEDYMPDDYGAGIALALSAIEGLLGWGMDQKVEPTIQKVLEISGIPEDKSLAFKILKLVMSSQDTIDSINIQMNLFSAEPFEGLMNSYLHIEAASRVLGSIPASSIHDLELQEAHRILGQTFEEYAQQLKKLSGDPSARKQLESDGYLKKQFDSILASHTKEYDLDGAMKALDTALKGITFIYLPIGNILFDALVSAGEILLGSQSLYAHLHAVNIVDTIYETLLSNLEVGNTWKERYAYAENIQRLCNLALVGERHIYEMTTIDAGAIRELASTLQWAFSPDKKNPLEENERWYKLRRQRLQEIYYSAKAYMDCLNEHYSALTQATIDMSDIQGYENEAYSFIKGKVLQDEWYARRDDLTQPDYDKPNPNAGQPFISADITLLADGQEISSFFTDSNGEYILVFPTHKAKGKQLTLQIEGQEPFEFADKQVPVGMPVSFSFRSGYPSEEKEHNVVTMDMQYADEYLLADNGYHHELAKLSLGLSAAAMYTPVSDQFWTTDGDVGRDANILMALDDMGYDVLESRYYDRNVNIADGCLPYVIADKWVEDSNARKDDPKQYRLIVVAFGGATDSPSVSCLYGADQEYIRQVEESLKKQITSRMVDGVPVRLWITGFSAGGTAANALYSQLSDYDWMTKNHVTPYAYTFAVPQTLANRGVYNLIYSEDLMAAGAPEETDGEFVFGWEDYMRYDEEWIIISLFRQLTGRNDFLPWAYSESVKEFREKLSIDMPGLFEPEDELHGLFSSTLYWQMIRGDKGETTAEMDLPAKHDMIIKTMKAKPSTEKDLSFWEEMIQKAYQSLPFPIFEVLPEEASLILNDVLLDILYRRNTQKVQDSLGREIPTSLIPSLFKLQETVMQPDDTNSLLFAHHPEMYLAWMMGITLTNTPRYLETPTVFHARVMPLQTNIGGYVYDEETKKPLKNATVLFEEAGNFRSAQTNEAGYWETSISPDTDHVLRFSCSGYAPETLKISADQFSKDLLLLNTYLAAKPLPKLVITLDHSLTDEETIYYRESYLNIYSDINPTLENTVNELLQTTKGRYWIPSREEYEEWKEVWGRAFETRTLKMAYTNGKYLSVAIDFSDYMYGDAPPFFYCRSVTVDMETGREIPLYEVLGYEQNMWYEAKTKLGHIIDEVLTEKQFYAYESQSVTGEDISDDLFKGYVTWVLTHEGLQLYFESGSVVAMQDYISQMMLSDLLIPYDRLAEMMPAEFMPLNADGKATCTFKHASPNRDGVDFRSQPGSRVFVHVNGNPLHVWVDNSIPNSVGFKPMDFGDELKRSNCMYAFGTQDFIAQLHEDYLDPSHYRVYWLDMDGLHTLADEN